MSAAPVHLFNTPCRLPAYGLIMTLKFEWQFKYRTERRVNVMRRTQPSRSRRH